jgi:hypothetical protein
MDFDSKGRQVRSQLGIDLGIITCVAVDVYESAHWLKQEASVSSPPAPSGVIVPSFTPSI